MVESEENLNLMRLIDKQYLDRPDYGSPRMTDWLQDQGYAVNRKRVARLMQLRGLQAITPGPSLVSVIRCIRTCFEALRNPSQSCVEYRHYLHPNEGRLPVFEGSH